MGRDPKRVSPTEGTPPDPALVKLVEALAVAQARRDHAAELAARRPAQTRTADAPRRDLQPLQL